MPILLDTSALIRLVAGTLNVQALATVASFARASDAFVSIISAVEIAQLEQRGRLSIGGIDGFRRSTERYHIGVVPLGLEEAFGAYALPAWDHRDPADLIIVATAIAMDAAVVTSDRKIIAYMAARALTTISC